MNWSTLDWAILGPAMLAGLLVLSTHVPLGQQVLKRGIIFLDLAVAQIAGLGVVLAGFLGWQDSPWLLQLLAMGAALLGAALLFAVEKYWADIQEAVIGCIFVLAACAGILLLHQNPHGSDQLKELLSGQILWVSYAQLLPAALIYGLLLVVWYGYKRVQHGGLFYLLFAIAITLSVQLVGVYLVFASLIMPAVAVKYYARYHRGLALLVGVVGYAGGLICSALFDLPAGAAIVGILAAVSLLALLHSRAKCAK